MRSIILVTFLLIVGCADSANTGDPKHATRDIIVRAYLIDGWRYCGIIGTDLVFEKDVQGGKIIRYISWLSPETYFESFEPTPRQPW